MNFPTSPALNDTYSLGSKTWKWNGVAWDLQSTGLTSAMVVAALGFTPYNATNPSGYITSSALSPYLTSATAASTYQPVDADLTAIAALTGSSGFLKTNGSGTWSVDTATYLTTATAASTYQTQSGMSSYLTTATASSTYLPLAGGTLTGNLAFSGTGLRITGDFSNATMLSRTLFQSSTANGNTQVGAIPNGTAVNSAFFTYNNSDPTNASTGILRINASEVALISGITGTGTYLPLVFLTNNLERGRFDTAGNFGIGTSSPAAKLDVVGDIFARASTLRFKDSGNTTQYGAIYGDSTSFHVNAGVNNLVFYSAGTDRGRFDSSGRFGVGLTPTANTYNIQSSAGISAAQSVLAQGTLQGYTGAGIFLSYESTYGRLEAYDYATTSWKNIAISPNGGNVGIGTSSPAYKLDVNGGIIRVTSANDGESIIATSATNNTALNLTNTGTNGATWKLMSTGGTSGYGQGNLAFERNNTVRLLFTSTGGFSVGTLADPGAGAIYATGNITAYYSSDRKFKENIREIPNALATVNAIGGKLFDWTDDYINSKGGADGYFVQKADFGVVAQDVKAVFPVAVRTRPDGSLAVDYEKLSALAFAAVCELTARVEALEAK